MPQIYELLDRLQGSTVCSTFEFADAFIQIPIHPVDRHKTSFHTCTCKLEYPFRPFGIASAPAEVQRQVNHGFSGSINEVWVIIHMDNTLVFSRTEQEHLQYLKGA